MEAPPFPFSRFGTAKVIQVSALEETFARWPVEDHFLDRAVGIHVRAALRGLGFRVSGVFDVLAPNTPKSGHAPDADSSNPSRQVVQGLSPTSASAVGVG